MFLFDVIFLVFCVMLVSGKWWIMIDWLINKYSSIEEMRIGLNKVGNG